MEGRKQGLSSGVGEASNEEDIRAEPSEKDRVDRREHPLREGGG